MTLVSVRQGRMPSSNVLASLIYNLFKPIAKIAAYPLRFRLPLLSQRHLLVWSTDFHRAAFALSIAKLSQPVVSIQYRFGTQESLISRAYAFFQILVHLVANQAIIYAPDSDCGITRLLVRLLSLLRLQSHILLLPDGFITTHPLSLQLDNGRFIRPVTADQVLRYMMKTRLRHSTSRASQSRLCLVALKRPQEMPMSDTESLAKIMLHDAAADFLSASAADSSVSQGNASGLVSPIKIHVICHRTFPSYKLKGLLRDIAARCSERGPSLVNFVPVEYGDLALECIASLYSLPSTVIWEIWMANPTALLQLYDPTEAIWRTPGGWVQDLSSALATTRSLARSKQGQLTLVDQRPDGIRVETWQLSS